MALDSNREWIQWGMKDPMWAVATEKNRRRGESGQWTVAEFYETGKRDWAEFLLRWKAYGVDMDSCVDFGCGAGRITKWMLDSGAAVTGVDVSPAMLEMATEHCDGGNFELIQDASLPLADGSVSAIFSCHVFQHLDSEAVAFAYLTEFYRVLKPNGSMMIHLPLHSWPSTGRLRKVYETGFYLFSSVNHLRFWILRKLRRPAMRGTTYGIERLYGKLESLGFKRIEFITAPLSRTGVLHSFVWATRE